MSRVNTELPDGGSFRKLNEAWLEISHYLAYEAAERRYCAPGHLAPTIAKPFFRPRPHAVRLRQTTSSAAWGCRWVPEQVILLPASD